MSNTHFIRRIRFALSIFLLSIASLARADYVGEAQTTKFLDKQTRDMIAARYQAGQGGLVVGDEVSYIIQFTPYPGGTTEQVGGGVYLTDYIPAGTQVIDAQFVQYNGGDGSYTQIAPPPPAEVRPIFVSQYSETGIFYSTDPRTAMYTNNGSTSITATNGLSPNLPAGGPIPYSVHNAWDASIFAPYVANPAITGTGCAQVTGAVPSPVAGPDTLIKGDVATGQGPWQRISYPGSTYGTQVGVPGLVANQCIGGVATSAGWPLSGGNPLPANTNAVRFAGGQTTVGQLFSVRIKLRITQPIPLTGLVNNSEVFGGDVSILTSGALGSKSNIWRYMYPSIANSDSTLTLVKSIVGMCTGAACVPQPYTGGSLPSAANLKVRYEITFLNSSGGAQTNVQVSDILPTGGALVAGSETVVSGTNILPTTVVAGGFNFSPLSTLGSGGGGTVQFDVNFATAPPANKVLVNTAKMTTTSLPVGVTSVASATPILLASLTLNKTTSTPVVVPGGVASYSITVPNNGFANATSLSVVDTLPSNGISTAIADRFSYQGGSATATLTNALGVVTAVTPVTAVVTAPTVAPFKEKVTFTFPAGTVIPTGNILTINFNAAVGSTMPATATPYLNDAKVSYLGGATNGATYTVSFANGVAPVTVVVPMTLSKAIDCVYSGVTCVPYSSGATIPTASKIRYRLSYANTSASALANVQLTDTLYANTSFVAGTAAEVGTPNGIVPPVVAGQLLTFAAIASLPAGATGAVTFDVQLGAAAVIPSGSTITNNAKIVSALYPGGVQASLTTSVLDSANLVVTKATSTPTIAVNGTATYTITVTNTGGVAATGIKIYDWLPFTGAVANANTRFNFTVGSTVFALQNPGTSTLATIAPVTTVGAANLAPHNIAPYLNQQQVAWTFTPAQTLAPGASFTLTFTAAAGAAGGIPAGSTVYKNDVQAVYTSGATTLYAGVVQTAPVIIPTNLVITKSIDCIYNAALTACNAYNGSGIIPVNAKVRYKIHYQNNAATAQTNVYICDQMSSTQTVPALAATITMPVTLAPTPAGLFTNTAAPDGPPVGAVTNPANAACGFAATGVRFSYPVIPALAAGASGDVYFDAATNVASTATLSNTGKIVSVEAPSGEVASVAAVALDVPVLSISKSTSTPVLSASGTANYTITIANTGSGATTLLKIYDFLPFSGLTLDATRRFTYLATTAYTKNGLTFVPTTPVISSVVTPLVLPYSSNLNQQQVLWDFGAIAGNQLAAGDTMTITFTATVGSAMPGGTYGNSIQAEFDSAGGPGSVSANAQAQVSIPLGVNLFGRVYADANHNGSPEASENWTGGPAVYVKLATLSGGVCVSPALSVQTISAPAGTYSFSGVAAGQYCIVLSANNTLADVAASIPAGWRNSMPTSGILYQTVAAWDVTNQNFGVYSGSSLAGRVFLDNGAGAFANNGVQDSGEVGINGVTVTANQAGCAATLCAAAITDGNGDYVMWLPSSVTGAVTVTEVNLSGYLSTGGQAGNTGGAYTRSTDTTAFSVVPGTHYSGLNFADVPDNQFLTDGAQSAMPGSVVFYPHTFIAGTSGAVSFAVSKISSPAVAGWSEVIYVDANCNAVIDAGEVVLPTSVAVTAAQTVCLLVKEFIPAAAPINAQNALTITATFNATFSGSAVSFNYLRHDTTTAGQATGSGLTLVKSVSTASALPGGDITYTVAYTNKSSGLLSSVIIYDATPFYTLFRSASCGVLPQNLSACVITAPAVNATGSIVYTMAGTLAPGSSGAVSFVVRVQP
ncbi:MAG: hypothetical protein PHP85_09835 [Gallionella sp.]|nr:hypothetical protein [Gallionella sp.]